MKKEQVQHLIESCNLPDACLQPRLIETTISWVIITVSFAFKIKKAIKLPFVDFSTVSKRYHFCKQELELNRQLAPEVYLTIFPITGGMISNNPQDREDEVIDYAVQMIRLDQEKQMRTLLVRKELNTSDIKHLADKIALFHKNARIIKDAFDTTSLQDEYAAIKHELVFIAKKMGQEWVEKIEESINLSHAFLKAYRSYMDKRTISNKRRDCHGDLTTRNIYFYKDPVIINRIEYNKNFRYIDVLNDVAVLCVDLDFHNQSGQSELFYQSYLRALNEEDKEFSRKVLLYYKNHRANNLVKKYSTLAMQEEDNGHRLLQLKKYLQLMHAYCEALRQ